MTSPLRTLSQPPFLCKPFQAVVALGLLALAFQLGDAHAQNPVTFGGSGFGVDVVVDEVGNTYVTGGFTGTVDFDPGPGVEERTGAEFGGPSAFVASYDGMGALRFVSTTTNAFGVVGSGIALDEAGNVYIAGSYEGTVDFDPGPGTEERTGDGAFVASYDGTGALRFVSATSGGRFVTGIDVATDRAGNAYVAGQFQGTVDFDPGPGVEERTGGSGETETFVASYDDTGALRFVSTTRGISTPERNGATFGNAISVSEAGNAYVTGDFGGTVDFDPGPDTEVRTSNGFIETFVASYDDTGALRFIIAIGGTSGTGIVLGEAGRFYVTGRFQDAADFDPGPDTEIRMPSGNQDAFVASYDSTGALRFVSTTSSDEGEFTGGSDVALDEAGNVYIVGSYEGTVDFDPGPGTEERTTTIGNTDAFVASYDGTGTLRFVSTATGDPPNPLSRGFGIALDGVSNVYIAGVFRGTVDFDPGPGIEARTSNGDTDAFVLKLNPDGTLAAPSAADSTPPECELVSVTPGPPTTLRVRVRDGGSGLADVRVIQAKNADVTVPDFEQGLTTRLFVTAEKLSEGQRATLVLEVEDVAGNVTTCDPVLTTVSTEVPETFVLGQNYPNPFNPTTTIRFALAERADVRLAVYDVAGREVALLVSDRMEAGSYEVAWEGRDGSGRALPSGLYLYRIEAGPFTETRVMALVK